MSTYYIARNGLQQGSFTIDEIKGKLLAQVFNWNDHVYDDQKREWVLLKEYDGLASFFKESVAAPASKMCDTSEVDPLKKRIWFILKPESNYGPYSKIELIQMLNDKTAKEYDFIWREGMSEWRRLSEVPEFSSQEMLRYHEKFALTRSLGDQEFFRRKFPRVKINGSAIVHDQKKIYKTVGVEISEGGAGLMIYGASFEKGQQLHLLFKTGQEVPAFNALCKVVSKKGNIYGVQFIEISVAAKSDIANFSQKKSAA